MKVEIATHDDIPSIVSLHIKAFEGFFLTNLGDKFLSLLYSEFISQSDSICLVAKDELEKVVGFAIGTLAPSIFFKKILVKRGHRFFLAAAPSLLKSPIFVFKKLFSAVFYRGDLPSIQEVSKPLLLSSIAVDPASKGLGVGRSLLDSFSIRAQEVGADCIYLTTDLQNNEYVNKFYLSNGFYVDGTLSKPGGRTMYRYIKVFRD